MDHECKGFKSIAEFNRWLDDCWEVYMTDREQIMTQFAKIRFQIEHGDRSSHPRDWLESVLDMYEEKIEDLKGEISNLEWMMARQEVWKSKSD